MTNDNQNLTPMGNGALPVNISDQTEAFCRKHPKFFRLVVSRYYPLDEGLIKHFGDCLVWKELSLNRALPWSIELIDRYKNQWNWGFVWGTEGLSSNKALPWSIDLIECYKYQWDWYELSGNEALPWSLDFIERYKDRWDSIALSGNEALPWSMDYIGRYKDRWNWDTLSRNEALPWSLDFIERFKDQWDFGGIRGMFGLINNKSKFNSKPIELFNKRHKEYWDWHELSGNEALPWNLDLIEHYKYQWDWQELSGNKALPWNIDLLERYKNQWNWNGLSGNEALPWSLDFFERYKDRWDWNRLSCNEALPWSINLIERFKDQWDWGRLSLNTALPWSHRFYERFAENWIIEFVAKIYDGNICNLNQEQVTGLLTKLTFTDALNKHEEVQQGVQGDATKQFNLAAFKLGDILPDGGIVFHVDASGNHGLAAQPADETGEADWDQAKILAEAHGQGWHLPTKHELNLLYQQKDLVGGFASVFYWSSTEGEDDCGFVFNAWFQNFDDGGQIDYYMSYTNRVRAVRAF